MIAEGSILRRIAIPSRAIAAVRAGSEVDVDTVIARRRMPGASFSVAVAGPLRRRASEAKDAILVRPGARLLSNQPIARAGKHEVRAPDDAIYLGYSVSDGNAHLAIAGPSEPFLSHVRGQVAQVDAEAVTVRLAGARVLGIGGSGAAVHGPLLMGVTGPGDELRPSAIDAQAEGRIVVGGAWASAETLTRARAIGVTGLILGGIHARALAEMDASLSRRRALGAGQADFGILVLEGYGRVGIEPTLFTWLAAQAGQMACLAGNDRELIVHDAPPAPHRSSPAAVGDRVVGTRRPTLGLTGVLVSLLPDLHAPSSGIPSVAGMVRLDDGRLMPIPLANLETVNPA